MKTILKYVIRTSKTQLFFAIIMLLIAIIVFLSLFFKLNLSFSDQWSFWLEAYATCSIILVSVAIWYNEKKENWISSLPKKLTIFYKSKNDKGEYEDYCRIENAPLAHEGDIRNWGQSIGQTILNDQTRINFAGFFISESVLDKNKKTLNYTLTVFLKSPIAGIEKGSVIAFDDEGCLEKSSSGSSFF
jgi:hypothetical protein